MYNDKVLVGAIIGGHGLKGEVRVKTFTASPENIQSYGKLFLSGGKTLAVLGLRTIKENEAIVRLDTIVDRTAAELLRGQELFVERQQFPELEADEYYQQDLVSLNVYTDDNTELGQVISVQNFGASDILEIKIAQNKTVMVPFIEDAIESVDFEEKRITVRTGFVI